jgi:hypothetical protein
LGDNQQAFEWLERAYQHRETGITNLRVDPVYDGIRSDPHYADLVRRIGLP